MAWPWLLQCVLLILLSFSTTALRPTDMSADIQHQLLKLEEHSNASSFSELQAVDAQALSGSLQTYFMEEKTVVLPDEILNIGDPEAQPCSFFHHAARQALSRLYGALCNEGETLGPGGTPSLLMKIKTGLPTLQLSGLSTAEKVLMQAIMAMESRLFFMEKDIGFTRMVMDIWRTSGDEGSLENSVKKLQTNLQTAVKYLTDDDPESESMLTGFAVPIYAIWKHRDAWLTLNAKVDGNGVGYYHGDQGYTLLSDFKYLCTVVVTQVISTKSTELAVEQEVPVTKTAYFPSPFIVFARYALEKVWLKADIGAFPDSSFHITGALGPEDWDRADDTDDVVSVWEKGLAAYKFRQL